MGKGKEKRMVSKKEKKKGLRRKAISQEPLFRQMSRTERKAGIAAYTLYEEPAIIERQEKAREKRIQRRKIKRETRKAKDFFNRALSRDSIESQQARSARRFIKGVTGSLQIRGGRGIRGRALLPRYEGGWSDMGLIAGTPFKEYKARTVFPSSLPNRILHPQEKAEIAGIVQKIRLFGSNNPPLQKKITEEDKENGGE